jgi:hypothetical protein
MPEKFIKKINLSDQNLLIYLQEKGLTLQEIEYFIIDTLSPYIRSKDFLQKQGVNFLAFEACNIATSQNDPTWKSFFEAILQKYETLSKTKSEFVLITMSSWNRSIYNGQRQTPQIFKLRPNPDDLDLGALEFVGFGHIQALIEHCMQPYLAELLCMERNWEREKVEVMKLGNIVDEVGKMNIFPSNFLTILPWNIKLHKWRNIAAHKNREVRNGKIICMHDGTEIIEICRNDLQRIEDELSKRLSALKTAREVFIFNHFEDFSRSKEFKRSFDTFELNADIITLDLSYACLVRGLEIHENQDTTFYLKDSRQSEGNIQAKIYEVIYFGLFQVLPHFEGENIVLYYDSHESVTRFQISIDGAEIKAHPESRSNLNKLVSFVDIKSMPINSSLDDVYQLSDDN